MSFASDKLYNGYVRRNMAIIVSKVKPREIIMHLPCLTAHDRDVIEAKTDTSGSYNGMMLLLDCLKRRENWPEQFIEALEACEQKTIAAEIRAEYNTLTAVNNSNPSSSPATVVRAHVHPAPSASYLPIPESGANSEAAVALPAVAPTVPLEPAAQAPPPPNTPTLPQSPESAADPVPKAISSPEPVPEAPKSTQIEVAHPPSTPPASPKTTRIRVTSTERDVNFRKEPEENSESDIQNVTADTDAQVSSGSGAVSVNSKTTPQPPHPVEHHEDPLKTTIVKKSKEPESPPKAQINSDGTGGSSVYTKTPEKPPVQDSTPTFNKGPAPVPQPEEISEPPATQIVETAAEDSPRPGAPVMKTSLDDDDVCLSKPGQLVSIHPQTPASAAIPASGLEAQPYSGNSDRLEISEAASDAVTSVGSAVDTVTPLPCQETGVINLNHNEPEENQYESPCQSFETQEELVIQVSEEPSIPNLDVNGETTKEISSAPPLFTNAAADSVSGLNTAPKEGEEQTDSSAPWTPHTTLPEFILVAAGVVVCAMLLVWRFKK
ncbi:mitochondrial antiviral-signaling protein [Archocentrus centrarchus]|uniref:mitochondrial antiviral-signaling protein n=1 Tax=Archocentrus centrarchus TaxID=63155 RepID=UPI0011EA2C8B|nr:mitochondrial antiviral-signaling protein [Archocentrus centrarchus]